MAATKKSQPLDPGFLFTPSDSFLLGHSVSSQCKMSQTDRRQTDRRHSVPKAQPIVRSAKNVLSYVYSGGT